MSSQRLPNKSFPKYKFQNFANVPNKLPTGTFLKEYSQHGQHNFPNCFGKEYSQLIFPTRFFQTKFQSFTKKFQNSPIKTNFPTYIFKLSLKVNQKGLKVSQFKKLPSVYCLDQPPCLVSPGMGNVCDICDKIHTDASNIGGHTNQWHVQLVVNQRCTNPI